MLDRDHSQKGDPELENGGSKGSAQTTAEKGGFLEPDYFPELKLSFSLSGFLLLLILLYKKGISPFLPRCCRFIPSCSAYAAEAVMVHGVFKGTLLALWRLCRCQPFCKGGYDPVPPKKGKKKEDKT